MKKILWCDDDSIKPLGFKPFSRRQYGRFVPVVTHESVV